MNYLQQLEQALKQINRYKKFLLTQNGLGITTDQWDILDTIREKPGINQKTLAQLTEKDPASIKRTLDLLEKTDLINRQKSTDNKRDHLLYLCEKGESIAHRMWPSAIDLRAKGTKGLSADDMEKLQRILGKITENLAVD